MNIMYEILRYLVLHDHNRTFGHVFLHDTLNLGTLFDLSISLTDLGIHVLCTDCVVLGVLCFDQV